MPANVQIIIKAYKDIINVKPLPDSVIDSLKDQFGLTANSTSTRLLLANSKPHVFRNRLIVAAIIALLLLVIIVLFMNRQRIWKNTSEYWQKQLLSVKAQIFWNLVIRCFIEMFYPMIVFALLAI
jgi:hypothetical protein